MLLAIGHKFNTARFFSFRMTFINPHYIFLPILKVLVKKFISIIADKKYKSDDVKIKVLMSLSELS